MNYFFLVLLIGVTAYALVAGGSPERIGAAIYAVGSVVTYFVVMRAGAWSRSTDIMAAIDVTGFVAFAFLALWADRFWTIWVSSLLGLGVLGHIARLFAGAAVAVWPYSVSVTIWSYPILAIMAAGTWNHQRRRSDFDTRDSVRR